VERADRGWRNDNKDIFQTIFDRLPMMDVTERKGDEAELPPSREQLPVLAGRFASAREEELGGEFTIGGVPVRGTTLRVRLPLAPASVAPPRG